MLDQLFILGRFHPLLVHLPIGILTLAFLLEIFSRRAKYAALKPAVPFALLFAGISALVTVFTGWIMPKNGQFDESLLNLHFWFGVALTFGIFILYRLSRADAAGLSGKLYWPFFILNMLLLMATGHFGGSLTHGSNYLFESNSEEGVLLEGKIEDIKLYEQVIVPVFKMKCTSCHNPEKLKGELLLTTKEGILKGGKTGAFLLPGDAAHSLVMERIALPKMEKEHMPPKGKVQLNNEEIMLLKWWIDEGADFEKTVGAMNPPPEIMDLLKKYKTGSTPSPTANLKPVDEKLLKTMRSKGILLNPQDENGILFEANLAYDSHVTREKINALKKISAHIVKLNFLSTNLDDELAREIRSFKNLQKLDLQHTDITSKGLTFLKKMNYLESLNLYATKIDDEAVPYLAALPALKHLYLWQSGISSEAVLTLQVKKPQLSIYHTIDKGLFSDAQLKAPAFITKQDLFKDSLSIEIDTLFKGVVVYYTLDGAEPDTNALVYKAPFKIYKTTRVKTLAHKAGWQESEVAEKVFVGAKYEITKVQLSTPPNESYQANGALSLVDFVKGGERFAEGGWLGYQGEHLTATLDLGASKRVSSVTVGALEDVGSYIFYPQGIEIFTSGDGQSFKKVSDKTIPIAKEAHPSEINNFLLEFDEIETRFVKVFVKSNLVNPPWHPAPGANCWIFIDEIVVN
ncbi:MAG: chitobiase/beta-hexosaminidase C-terminal domain-containing protein [Saprospiraceae bacterium]|nr:chitobiase/beta-hexosaminidase C-terminal domain-containing protein [Saprospiraceae bacterium]MCB9322342.1 chitobiase/beta-hexosaminidase C-terminal domain-containing protein [Lewinellaceae bacterium]